MDPQPGGNERNQSSQSQLVDHKRSLAQPDQNGADMPRLAGTSNMDNDQYCLRWNNYETNILGTFGGLLEDDALSDVTLFSEGDSFRAHRLVLSACSTHFAKLFGSSPFHGPVIVILDGTRSQDLHILLQFMYKGVAYLHQDRIDSVLRAAEVLQVKGLSDGHTVENVSKDGNSISDEGGASYIVHPQASLKEDKNEDLEERDTAGSMEAVESPLSLNTNGTPGTSPSWTPHSPHPEETENGSQCAANIDIKTESNSPGSTSPHPPQSYSEDLQDSQGEGRRTPISTGSQDSVRTDDFQINLGTNDVDESLKQETNLETFRRIIPASETNCDPGTQFTTLHKMDVPYETNQGRPETNQGRQPENNYGRQPENYEGRQPETDEGRQLETNQGRQPFQGQSFQNFQFPLSAPLEIPDSEVSRMVNPGQDISRKISRMVNPGQDISRKITRMVNPGQDISHEVPNFSTKSGTKLKCPFCDRTYGYDTNLRAHIRQCHQGIRVPCPFCHRSFTRNNTVRRHIAREHRHHINSSLVPAKFAKTKVLPDSLFQEYLNQSSRKFTIACQYFNQTFKSSQLDSSPKSISDQQTKFANMKLDRI